MRLSKLVVETRDLDIYGDAKTMSNEVKITSVEIKGTNKAFYQAGISEGRVNMFTSMMTEFKTAIVHYETEVSAYIKQAEDNHVHVDVLKQLLDSLKNMINQNEKEISSAKKEARDAFLLAASALKDEKGVKLGDRLRGAVDGALAGFLMR